ncbi:MAG: 6-carboxytetrahydropterin synthase [Methylococcaceae bacterium]|jgi:6-pyruvoyltetrahydropterin/6-carboxytetrahydropterin synthase|nr:6-carboxytetrahydropterin synthase [Methylococcaceae bacterium]
MYSITKEIYFCYGHRLMHHAGKCRHLHGHSVKAAVTVAAQELNRQGMVCDFSDIKASANAYIEEQLDHNFLVYQDDPIIPWLTQNNERFMPLNEHPTAEVLAKMIYLYMKDQGFAIEQVTLWETDSSYACYREP